MNQISAYLRGKFPILFPYAELSPIIGWRAWEIQGRLLRSFYFPAVWPSKAALRSVCLPICAVPCLKSCHNSGIHAFRSEANMNADFRSFLPYPRYCTGQVYLWGQIIEHELGYRAEYAYPKELWVSDCCDPLTIMQLEENYGVPVNVRTEPLSEENFLEALYSSCVQLHRRIERA